ncbi:MAG: hypothetical protein GIX03_09150 [Candidatus Eremiobacteraeota bacterium]|nr:hypothetical protein [Candidatus Eremiobacteraeota bacterium]MBC5803139.1 hypothetical protein [Candidatus Eremiobacteraeota bacterium]MBC5820773.1 hypothetical protein [Candidatus Eremiobacteraeota bacterium]
MTVRDFDFGLLLGLLIAQGHFGGDRKQAQITLKMHVRHLPLLEWAFERLPGARLYGPYEYGPRRFYQLMVRGDALRNRLVPLLDTAPWPAIDPHSYARYEAMKERYGLWSGAEEPSVARATANAARTPPPE